MRKRVFRLPVEVPYVPRRKRPFYVIYGILSGMYSYVLLSFLMIVTYHILRSFSPEWAFVPAAAIGVWVFRSRIKLLVKFMKMLYLDKKERVRAWFTPARIAVVSTVFALVFFLPIWPDFVQGPFVLAPTRMAMLRAAVPGTVASVSVREGDEVAVGTPLVLIRNLDIESRSEEAQQGLNQATAKMVRAVRSYTDLGAAEQERQRQVKDNELAGEQVSRLAITSPISGIVATPHTEDLVGRSLDAGDLVLQVTDNANMKGQIYIPEFAMHDVHIGEAVRLLPQGRVRPISGVLSLLSPTSVPIAEGLASKEQLQGINPPRYFLGTVWLKNDGEMLPGVMGTAKVLVARRSLGSFGLRFCRELVYRKVW